MKNRIEELRELKQSEAALIGKAYEEKIGLLELMKHVEAFSKYENELRALEANERKNGR